MQLGVGRNLRGGEDGVPGSGTLGSVTVRGQVRRLRGTPAADQALGLVGNGAVGVVRLELCPGSGPGGELQGKQAQGGRTLESQ